MLTHAASALLAAAVTMEDEDATAAITEIPPEAWPSRDMAALARTIARVRASGEPPRIDALMSVADGNADAVLRALSAVTACTPTANPSRCAREIMQAHRARLTAETRDRVAALFANHAVPLSEIRYTLADCGLWDDDAVGAGWRFADVRAMLTAQPPAQDWILDGFLPRGVVGQIAATGGTGKTFFLLALATALAAGRPAFRSFTPPGPMRVLALLGEDPEHEIHRRLHAILEDVDPCIADRLSLVCGHAEPLMRMDKQNPATGLAYDWLRDQIRTKHPDLVILDPQNRFYGLDENSNDHAAYFIARLTDLCNEGHCTILLAHHVSKHAGETRGASAFRDGCRWAAQMETLDQKRAEALGLDANEAWRYVVFRQTKQSYAPSLAAPIYFERLEGGALAEVDLRQTKHQEVVDAVVAAIGETNARLTARQIAYRAEGAEVRKIVQRRVPSATRPTIERALNVAVEQGLLRTITVTSGRNHLAILCQIENNDSDVFDEFQ